ncbi:MAG: general stress protein [Cytobacillus gottheilii]|uniref:general stress protein n=1 Tax=Cytobacillus gottheilii TaxID=859144 RepID=UPI003463E37E
MYKVEVVENGVQATNTIDMLNNQGYSKEHIYIFAHDKDRSENLTDATDTGSVGIKEQGLFDSVGNVFKKRGDELRTKFESLGLTTTEAEQYEEVLDQGKLVIVGSDSAEK